MNMLAFEKSLLSSLKIKGASKPLYQEVEDAQGILHLEEVPVYTSVDKETALQFITGIVEMVVIVAMGVEQGEEKRLYLGHGKISPEVASVFAQLPYLGYGRSYCCEAYSLTVTRLENQVLVKLAY